MSQVDVNALKQTLSAQQQLLQKLYNELDVEREASASAASEALSMILRLQGEKAAVQMEAKQYKRLAEEKICYAEESLEIFEDLIYQKEMEIATLDYQVQAYRYKLQSIGCVDPGVGEIKFPKNLLQRSETIGGDMNLQALIGRRNSAPLFSPKNTSPRKGIVEGGSFQSFEADLGSKITDEQTSHEVNDSNVESGKVTDGSNIGDLNSYWEQIKKLDERVKGIAKLGTEHTENAYESRRDMDVIETKQCKSPESLSDRKETTASSSCSPNVLDVFEVPQTVKNLKNSTIKEEEIVSKRDKRLPPEPIKLYVNGEADRPKRNLRSKQRENGLRRTRSAAIASQLAIPRPPTSLDECQPLVNKLRRSSEITKPEQQSGRQESRDEELRLLKEIKEQLNLMRSEMRSWKSKKSSPADELSLVPLMEEMLHFWV